MLSLACSAVLSWGPARSCENQLRRRSRPALLRSLSFTVNSLLSDAHRAPPVPAPAHLFHCERPHHQNAALLHPASSQPFPGRSAISDLNWCEKAVRTGENAVDTLETGPLEQRLPALGPVRALLPSWGPAPRATASSSVPRQAELAPAMEKPVFATDFILLITYFDFLGS